jgi:hypothetical protein
MHRSLVALTSLLTLASACAPETDEAERLLLGAAPSPIEGGYMDDADKHVVGLIRYNLQQGLGACSGTLIAPNVVLTAQHCVAPTSSGGSVQCGVSHFGALYPANELFVTTKTSFTAQPSDYWPAREVHVPPNGTSFCGNDQALIILTDSIGPDEATPSVPRVDTSLLADEEYYAVGYGALYDGANAPSGTRYRRDSLFARCIGLDCGAPNQITDTEFLGDTGVCQGDSGGPAFDLDHRVAGVASRGGAGCEFPIYGHVYGLGQWIKDVTVYAAGLAGEEPPPWATGWPTDPAFSHPVGAACTHPSDCPSNACLEGYCTRACNESAPCAGDYRCSPDGFCEQLPPPPAPPGDKKATTTASCALGSAKDPTKPIPWKWALVALALVARRRLR